MPESVHVTGLRELQSALRKTKGDVKRELRDELQRVSVPVKVAAQNNVIADVSHITQRWSGMRIGVTTGGVYVAPSARRRDGSARPNLAPLLLKGMEDAVDENAEKIIRGVEQLIDNISEANGF